MISFSSFMKCVPQSCGKLSFIEAKDQLYISYSENFQKRTSVYGVKISIEMVC